MTAASPTGPWRIRCTGCTYAARNISYLSAGRKAQAHAYRTKHDIHMWNPSVRATPGLENLVHGNAPVDAWNTDEVPGF